MPPRTFPNLHPNATLVWYKQLPRACSQYSIKLNIINELAPAKGRLKERKDFHLKTMREKKKSKGEKREGGGERACPNKVVLRHPTKRYYDTQHSQLPFNRLHRKGTRAHFVSTWNKKDPPWIRLKVLSWQLNDCAHYTARSALECRVNRDKIWKGLLNGVVLYISVCSSCVFIDFSS